MRVHAYSSDAYLLTFSEEKRKQRARFISKFTNDWSTRLIYAGINFSTVNNTYCVKLITIKITKAFDTISLHSG